MRVKYNKTGVYQLIYKGEAIDEADTVIEATKLLKEYNTAFIILYSHLYLVS